MPEDMGEKTEMPSERKLADARREGQIARSMDLSSAVQLIGAIALVYFFGSSLVRGLGVLMHRLLAGENDGADLANFDASSALPTFLSSTLHAIMVAWPLVAVMVVVVTLSHLQQTGLLLTTKPLEPKFERLNPVSGFARLFERKNLIKTLLSVVKLSVVALVAASVIARRLEAMSALPSLSAIDAMRAIFALVMELAVWLLAILLIIGVTDWIVQKWQHRRDLRMTKQEVRDERRSMEGDEDVKARRRSVARQMAQQRVRSSVPKANVVVTNPTHFAVALRYDAQSMAAPKVVAKGADWLAFQIRSIAISSGVPIVEKPELARALYAAVPVGREVPAQHYQAVAEILAYVYRLNGDAESARAHAQEAASRAEAEAQRESEPAGVP